MRAPADPIAIVEAAYDLEGDDDAWLGRLAAQARPELDGGLGLVAFRFDASGERFTWSEPAFASAGDVARDLLHSVNRLMSPALVDAMFRRETALTTASEASGLGAAFSELPVVRLGHAFGTHDVAGLRVTDLDGRGVVLFAPLKAVSTVPSAARRPWLLLGAHIAAGLRVRGALQGSPLEGAEAVLTPDGRCAHAEGAARSRTAGTQLRDAVLRAERARGALRRSDPGEALRIWQGLVAGRWSLIEHFDHDGRRFLVARPNEPDAPDPRALTTRERQVLGYAALGHPLKLVAYALGLSTSTVSGHLKTALRKLGLRSRSDAIRVVGRLPLA